MNFFFGDATVLQIVILGISALLIGANKMGIPAIGILPVVLLAMAFPSGKSPGIQLILLAAADVLAVAYYRRHANWKVILRLIPFALIGILLGTIVVRQIDADALQPVIGGLILALVILNLFRERLQHFVEHQGLWMAVIFGILLGFTTQLANAAGPISAMYLILMRLKKQEYMGVAAWTFLILNCIKLPIFISEGRITMEAFWMDVGIFPLVLLGGVLGVTFFHKIPQRRFDQFVQVLVFLSAVYILVRYYWN